MENNTKTIKIVSEKEYKKLKSQVNAYERNWRNKHKDQHKKNSQELLSAIRGEKKKEIAVKVANKIAKKVKTEVKKIVKIAPKKTIKKNLKKNSKLAMDTIKHIQKDNVELNKELREAEKLDV